MLAPMSKPHHLSLLLLICLVVLGPLDVRAQPQAPDLGPVPVTSSDPSWGDDTAPVTMVVFTDLQCPFCQRIDLTIGELEQDYGPKQLRVIYKHLPLPFHKQARPAAEAADALRRLRGDDAFYKFTTEALSTLRSGSWQDVAKTVGVDSRKLQRLINTGTPGKKVDQDMALAKQLGVRGTPNSFINGLRFSGAQPKAKFVEVIDQQLAAATALRRKGVAAKGIYVALAKQNYQPPKPAPAPGQGRGVKGQRPGADTTTVWKVPVGASPTVGPKSALVTLVVFSDFQCPYCAKLVPILDQLRIQYGKQIRVVYKHNPLPFHKRAEPAAQLTMEAFARRGQVGFWQAHDKVFANHRNLEDPDLEQLAIDLKLNPVTAMRAVRARKHKGQIEADQGLAVELDARGTPCSFINGRRLTGARPIEAFVPIIDEEIAHAKKLLARGVAGHRLYAEMMKTAMVPPVAPTKTVAAPTKINPTRGSKWAKVTIQMFTDFECPFCERAQATLEQIEKAYPGKVRFVHRHLPRPFHKNAPLAHEAAAEAFRQGGNRSFWKMHDLLFKHQSALDRASLANYAAEVGLNGAMFDQALDSGRHQKAIAADAAIAKKADISGTPAFVINGYYLSGTQPFSKFKRIIDHALKQP